MSSNQTTNSNQDQTNSMNDHPVAHGAGDNAVQSSSDDGWPEDAPRALLAPWEESMAREGFFDQISHLFAADTVFNNKNFRRLRPNPRYKKEWSKVQEIYRNAHPGHKRRYPEISPDDDFSDENLAPQSPRGDKRARDSSSDSDDNTPRRNPKRASVVKKPVAVFGESEETSLDVLPRRRNTRRRSETVIPDTDGEGNSSGEPMISTNEASPESIDSGAEQVRVSQSVRNRPIVLDTSEEESLTNANRAVNTSTGSAEEPVGTRRSSRNNGHRRPVIEDSEDSSTGDKNEDASTDSQEGQVGTMKPSRDSGRRRPVVEDSEDRSADNEKKGTGTDSTDEPVITRKPSRANERRRPVIENSEDGNTGPNATAQVENENMEEVLNVEDTAANIDTSNFLRRSTRRRSHPTYY